MDDNGFPDPQAEIEQVHQAQYQRVNLDSDFDSLELNYRRRWMGPTCLVQGSWLVGVRYFELEDRLQFYSFADRDLIDPPGEESGGEAWYDLKTRNYMTGAQLGGDVWMCLLPGLRLGLDGKAGLYGNNVKVNTVMYGYDIYDNYIGFISTGSVGQRQSLVHRRTAVPHDLSDQPQLHRPRWLSDAVRRGRGNRHGQLQSRRSTNEFRSWRTAARCSTTVSPSVPSGCGKRDVTPTSFQPCPPGRLRLPGGSFFLGGRAIDPNCGYNRNPSDALPSVASRILVQVSRPENQR